LDGDTIAADTVSGVDLDSESDDVRDGEIVTVDSATEIELDAEPVEVREVDEELETDLRSSGAGACEVSLLGTAQSRLPEPQQQAHRLVLKLNTMSCVQ